MLALVGCPFGPFGSDPRQVQSCRLTGAFTRHDPPDSLTDRWIQAQRGSPHDDSADHQHRFPRGPVAAAHAITPPQRGGPDQPTTTQLRPRRPSFAGPNPARTTHRPGPPCPTSGPHTPWGTPPRGNAAPTRGRHHRRTPRRLSLTLAGRPKRPQPETSRWVAVAPREPRDAPPTLSEFQRCCIPPTVTQPPDRGDARGCCPAAWFWSARLCLLACRWRRGQEPGAAGLATAGGRRRPRPRVPLVRGAPNVCRRPGRRSGSTSRPVLWARVRILHLDRSAAGRSLIKASTRCSPGSPGSPGSAGVSGAAPAPGAGARSCGHGRREPPAAVTVSDAGSGYHVRRSHHVGRREVPRGT